MRDIRSVKDITQDDLEMAAYMQLKDIRKKEMPMKDRINMLRTSLHLNCSEAFGLLGMELRDNFDKLNHHGRMSILEALEKSEIIGCMEPLLDILYSFETMEPKSRYLYEQISKVIDVIGKSRKRWLVPLLTEYSKSSSRLLRESAQNVILNIKDSDDVDNVP